MSSRCSLDRRASFFAITSGASDLLLSRWSRSVEFGAFSLEVSVVARRPFVRSRPRRAVAREFRAVLRAASPLFIGSRAAADEALAWEFELQVVLRPVSCLGVGIRWRPASTRTLPAQLVEEFVPSPGTHRSHSSVAWPSCFRAGSKRGALASACGSCLGPRRLPLASFTSSLG